MDNRHKALLKRIKTSSDGHDLIAWFTVLEAENFATFRVCDSNLNDIHKGFAICIDKILEAFRQCDKEEIKQNFDNLI